jgi:molybdate transport system regulatory protein
MAGSKGSKYYDIFLDYSILLEHRQKGNIMNPLKFKLLKAIRDSESLKQAASECGVSYRKAWDRIRESEEALGFKLVETQRGGSEKGRTTLTEDGTRLVEAHAALREDFDKAIHKITRTFFHSLNVEKK